MTPPHPAGPSTALRASLSDRYTIERELGQGGMATVYLAHDIKHDRKVAIKVLKPELAAVLGADRFVQEIRTTAALQHPHILPLFDSGVAGTFLYYVMPYIEGETLRSKLDRETQLGINESVKITTEVADALDYAHRHGVIHRDVKPENILLHDGRPMVADFGIALAVSAAAGGRMTETGLSLGTPHYMSPEQATAEKEITGRSDIYSLGSVLYEMLTGNPPHTGASARQIVMKIVTEDAAPVTKLRKNVPPNVAAAVSKSLEKLPADRFETASEFARALNDPAFTTARASQTRRESAMTGANAWITSPWSWSALAAIVLLATALVVARRAGVRTGGVTFTQKTFQDEAILVARYGADGKTLVFSATRGGAAGTTPHLYVIRPDYAHAEPIGPDSTHLLAISTTGELAVLTHAKFLGHRLFTGTLATMPMSGGAPRELLAEVREADWSPDGTAMAVIRRVGGVDQLEYPIGTVIAKSTGYLSDPRVSPSGREIAIVEHPVAYDDRGTVTIIDRQGKRLAQSPVHWAVEGMAWQPDGSEVYYSATFAVAGSYSSLTVYALNHQSRERHVLSSAGGITVHDVARSGQWLITQDGDRYVVFARGSSDTSDKDVSWLDLSDEPVLSADGKVLAFADEGITGGENYAVMLRKLDGSPPVRLGQGAPLAFSHDGAWILGLITTSPPRLLLYPTGAGTPRPLNPGPFESITYQAGDIFADGSRYFFCGNLPRQQPQCFTAPLAGGVAVAVTPNGTTQGILSSDGKRVAAQVGDSFRIFDVSGGPGQPILGLTPGDHLIRWSPDNRELWVFRYDPLVLRVDRVAPESGKRSRLIDITPPAGSELRQSYEPRLNDNPLVHTYTQTRYSSSLFVVDGAQ
ncbi:MAG TPA: protein kinase [Gemmatimonadales bacterium]|jgi:tRNA A-37 threonylcarbamoyl transferase component Bud32